MSAPVLDAVPPDAETVPALLVLRRRTAPELSALVTEDSAMTYAFKLPTRWLVTADVADVPLTATGKVDKDSLRTMLAPGAKTSRGIAEQGDPGGVSADVR